MTDRMSAADYRAQATRKPRRHKYGARAAFRCSGCGAAQVNGAEACACDAEVLRFDSQAEARRWDDLRLLELAGEITELRCQVPYPITTIGGIEVGRYFADFTYRQAGELVVEDVKGHDTALSRHKRRFVEAQYGVKVRIIQQPRGRRG